MYLVAQSEGLDGHEFLSYNTTSDSWEEIANPGISFGMLSASEGLSLIAANQDFVEFYLSGGRKVRHLRRWGVSPLKILIVTEKYDPHLPEA